MDKVRLLLFLLLAMSTICFQSAFATGNCPPTNFTGSQLSEIKQAGFKIENSARRNELAVLLMACVGHPDPDIRDGIAYEGIAIWLRGKSLSIETTDVLYDRLLQFITAESDENGFQQPFSALILSEVARTDRIDDIFSDSKRAELVEVAAAYLENVRDYRGFSETDGWRHGVAHGADLVLQLVLNQHINTEQVRRLMQAVATQVSPGGETFYTYGEPGRLARAVFYAHRRSVLEDASWKTWLDGIADPRPLQDWSSSYSSQAGLAKRHNTLAFLRALYLYASVADNEQGEDFANQITLSIRRIL